MKLQTSVRAGLKKLGPLDERDRAVADLALRYAAALDAAEDGARDAEDGASAHLAARLEVLGPKLLSALAALLMTPAARAAITKPATTPGAKPKSPLDELRERRAARGE